MSLLRIRSRYFILAVEVILVIGFLIFGGGQKNASAKLETGPLSIFPTYPGARLDSEISQELMMVLRSLASSKDSTKGEIIALRTSDSLDKVIKFYCNNPPADGWKKVLELTKEGASFIVLWEKDGESAQILVGKDDGKTVILLGYGEKPANREDKTSWTFYTEKDGLIEDIATDIAEGKDGSIWFGTSDGLIRFVENEWKNYTFGPLGRGIKDIAVGDNGDLWVGTWLEGLMYFDGSMWKNITETEGLIHDRVSSIAIAEDGNVWVASSNRKGGVSVFDGTEWTIYSENSGLPSNYVYSIAVGPGDDIWVGTKEGVAVFYQGKWTSFTIEDGLLDNEIEEIVVDARGDVWAVSERGVNRYSNSNWRTYSYEDGFFGGKVFQLETSSNSYVWFATKSGISRFDGVSMNNFSEEDGLPDTYFLSILITSNGKIWLGTTSLGIMEGSYENLQ